jgi:hypothetical protein
MMVPAIAFAFWFAFAAVPPADMVAGDETSTDASHVGQVDQDGMETVERVKPKLISPAMVAAAESFINLPMGSERYAMVGGKRYVFVLEQHYHPPGYVGGPTGYHKGVTMYELR